MRIAIVTHCVVETDGQGRVNYEIASACLRNGHELVLLASDVDPKLTAAGAKWHRIEPVLRSPWLVRAYDFARRSDAAIEHYRDSVDIIVANGFTLRKQHDVNLSHFVHHAWRTSSGNPFRNGGGMRGVYQRLFTALNCRWEREAYRASRVVVAIAKMVRKDLLAIGVSSDQLIVIPNGVDPKQFYRPAQSASPAERAAFGLPSHGVLALFVGDLKITRKNLDTVMQAMTQIPNLQLAVVGGTERSSYPQGAIEMGIANRVHFLGFRDDVAPIMRCCDFFVMPSRYDPFALVILEAMASGLPVVTASTTGASDLVSSACGFVMDDPEDVAQCSRAMLQLTMDEPLRRRMGHAARETAVQHTWDRIAADYIALFESVAKSRRTKAALPLANENIDLITV